MRDGDDEIKPPRVIDWTVESHRQPGPLGLGRRRQYAYWADAGRGALARLARPVSGSRPRQWLRAQWRFLASRWRWLTDAVPTPYRAVAVALVVAIGLGVFGATVGSVGTGQPVNAADLAARLISHPAGRTDAASRSAHRLASGASAQPPGTSGKATSPPGKAKSHAKPHAKATRHSGAKRPTAPAVPAPVAGLSRVQMAHAVTVVNVGRQMRLPRQALIIAIATAMQESKLLNLANWGSQQSLAIPHDGVGNDFDSVGLFQQRPASGWGTVAELMDPATAARRFYQALVRIPGWQTMPVTVAAQSVQGSAYPDAYAAWVPLATQVVDALGG